MAAYIRAAQEEGLWVILRPGPYICTEWDFGGLPSWLLSTSDLKVRTTVPRFLEAAAKYLKRVGQQLAPLQITRGGPIIMVQVENEYGSFGNDHDYWMLSRGISVNLYMVHGGTSWGFLSGANFDGTYQPDIFSYDYDAPLDEARRPTRKFFLIHEAIKRYLPAGTQLPELPAPLPMIEIPRFELREAAGLAGLLGKPVPSEQPKTMEALGQQYGFVLFSTSNVKGPVFLRGQFELSSLGDTFLDMRGWGKGYVWVNGHNLGRYWKIVPQQCMFVPSMWLSKGINQVLVLDLEPADQRTLQGIKVPIWSVGIS